MTNEPDETKCPLCGNDNNCYNVSCRIMDCSERLENNCWCDNNDIIFPTDLTDKIPLHMKRKACICRSCMEIHNAGE